MVDAGARATLKPCAPGMLAPESDDLQHRVDRARRVGVRRGAGLRVAVDERPGSHERGSCDAGAIVQTPEPSQPAPETLNAIVSAPAAAFASVIAWRSEPAPESLVLVTVKVAADALAA